MKAFILLNAHSEYSGFDGFGGIYNTIDDAIDDMKKHVYKAKSFKVYIAQYNDDAVYVPAKWKVCNEFRVVIADASSTMTQEEFKKDPNDIAYSPNESCGFDYYENGMTHGFALLEVEF